MNRRNLPNVADNGPLACGAAGEIEIFGTYGLQAPGRVNVLSVVAETMIDIELY